MSWLLGEAPAQSIRTYIWGTDGTDGAMTAKLADVAARDEYEDQPIDLPDFAAVRLHAPLSKGYPEPAFPVLFIRPVGGRMILGPGGLGRGGTSMIRYLFVVVCEDPTNPETALLKALRYMVAVLEMLAESYHVTLRPYSWGMDNGVTFDYSPMESRESGQYFADVRIEVSTQIREAALV